nr:FtsX-like permease family protein [Actinomycetota bacterium]
KANLINTDYAISLQDYGDHFAQNLDTNAYASVADGATIDQARAAITKITDRYPDVTIQDQTEYKAAQSKAIDQFLGLVTALLVMAVLIALFGIVNTLGLSIYERVRELGLLRAVGMSRTQVKRMIRVESVIIAVLGAVLGVAIGILFGVAMQRALADIGITELAIPVPQLVAYVVVAGIAGVVAAIVPARRAAKLNVLQAISYE